MEVGGDRCMGIGRSDVGMGFHRGPWEPENNDLADPSAPEIFVLNSRLVASDAWANLVVRH